jgi:hypothetical protein
LIAPWSFVKGGPSVPVYAYRSRKYFPLSSR